MVIVTAGCQPADDLEIDGAWVRATPPNRDVTAAYLVIRNRSDQPRELLSVETPPWRESGNGARNGDAAAEASPALSLEDYFRHFLREHQDSMTETELARQLGISRKCLWERRQRYDIPRKKRQTGAG